MSDHDDETRFDITEEGREYMAERDHHHRVDLNEELLDARAAIDELKAVLITLRREIDHLRAENVAFQKILDSMTTRQTQWYYPKGKDWPKGTAT